MSKQDPEHIRRRNTLTAQERRDRFDTTNDLAMATIGAEIDARREKTERLKAQREAAGRSSSG
ncbi:hypothetical protein [Rhizobium sp. BE258]|jgi:hypothetical protein|uniref:hypothetical protein n=1 Tax=unclassified Rhizobium TaxID=2613769 RepID=UPI000DD5AF2B|nr:hypothetical protein [Rhizobium sp. BE258]MDR7147499.1 hypothetical protein [Rhizobium sp. BE258]